jgi:acetamidase/formamidase
MSIQEFGPDDLKYVYSAEHVPIGSVEADERFVVETADCFTGRFTEPGGFNDENIAWVDQHLNGVTGPIYVNGAVAGGAVEVSIKSIAFTTPGIVVVSRCHAHSPQDWWYEEDHVVTLPIIDDEIRLREGWSVPVRPLIGCLATAPDRETVFSRHEGRHGGNLDCGEVAAGATVTLPVEVDGAYLYFGDCKAAMGDGEVTAAPEVGTRIVASARPIERPSSMGSLRVRSANHVTTLVSAPSLTDACREAFRQLKFWIQDEWQISPDDATVLMGIGAHCGVGQVSNLLHTGKCSLALDLLPAT